MQSLLYVLGALALATVVHGYGLSGTVMDIDQVKVLTKDSFNPMYDKEFNYVITFPQATGYVVLMKMRVSDTKYYMPRKCENSTGAMWNITLSSYHPACGMHSGSEYTCRGDFSFAQKADHGPSYDEKADDYYYFMLVNCHAGLYGVTYDITDKWGPPVVGSSPSVSIVSTLTVTIAALLSYIF